MTSTVSCIWVVKAWSSSSAPATSNRETMCNDKLHYSIMPWVSFTAVKHARRFGREESVPKIVFGKIFAENGQWKMPVSVEANHALMDGLHVGRYFELFQQELDVSSTV